MWGWGSLASRGAWGGSGLKAAARFTAHLKPSDSGLGRRQFQPQRGSIHCLTNRRASWLRVWRAKSANNPDSGPTLHTSPRTQVAGMLQGDSDLCPSRHIGGCPSSNCVLGGVQGCGTESLTRGCGASPCQGLDSGVTRGNGTPELTLPWLLSQWVNSGSTP
jgi:hypothetical protein